VGVSNDTLWEVQWHPAGGGRFRRVVLTRRSLRRVLAVLGVLGLLVLAVLGALPLGLRGFFARFTVEAARRENDALRDRHNLLEGHAQDAAAALYAHIQLARRFAWAAGVPGEVWSPPCTPPPARSLGEDAIIGWATTNQPRLDALAAALASSSRTPRCPLANLPTASPLALARAVPVALFGWRTSPFTGKIEAHHGVNLAAQAGEPVLAPGGGRVVFAGAIRERRANEWTRLGDVVVLDHGGGVETVFGHLGEIGVRPGQTVTRGQPLGEVGQTGWTRVPALYYEVRWPLGAGSKPIDPALVTLSLPIQELDARLAAPAGDLPDNFAPMERLQTAAARRGARPRRAH
jgi:murein DD-endopeptidase MepM/ murein hydrolase activator NlpD